MKQIIKPTTDEDLIKQFLEKGGKVSVGKTKPMPSDLGISNNSWGNKMTKEEKEVVKAGEKVRAAEKAARAANK
ncbi:MAG: hypothetical protein ACI9KK_000158 [Ascidiaceihabitans sp.]|jgi:hypothetical protein|tara:strand:- start:4807 stop:5028 length:222 start_codon:yes stop_codon:yes gene_type:complete